MLRLPPALLLAVCLAAAAAAAEPRDDPTVLLSADELVHDEAADTVTARGNVELSQGARVLLADEVTYDRNTGAVTATGNIRLLEPGGEVIFSDHAVLDDAMTAGYIENLRLIMRDGSRLAANRAEHQAGQGKSMDKAVFSPCKPCSESSDGPPLWQIRASRVVHNEAAQDVEYRDAVLEVGGVPVFYTPYFVHPDPTVARRTGFLTPDFGFSDSLGYIYGQPFFYAIDVDRDLEVEPVVYTEEGLIIRSRYRQAFANGSLDFFASGGVLDGRTTRSGDDDARVEGSVDLAGRFVLNDAWRTGIDVEAVSERTYLRRFDLNNDDVLASQVFLEGFRGRDHALVAAYKYQGLRSRDSRRREPLVLPVATYSHVRSPDALGGRLRFDAAVLSLTREIGADSHKLSVVSGWQLPHYAARGDIYTMTAQLQSDFYVARNPTGAEAGALTDDVHRTARLYPQLGLNWRYPFIRAIDGGNQIVEPIVNMVLSPQGGNPPEIPNEDSQTFEFDDTNIFNINRFGGSDRVTSGTRVDYGVKASMYEPGLGLSEAFFGQSVRGSDDSAFDSNSGLHDKVSDYVGRVRLSPSDWLDMLVRFRLDKDRLRPLRRELDFSLRRNGYRVNVDYIQLDQRVTADGIGDREQIDLRVVLPLHEYWIASGQLIHDLSGDTDRTLSTRLGLAYVDECLEFGLQLSRREVEDNEIEPEDRILFKIKFKYLG